MSYATDLPQTVDSLHGDIRRVLDQARNHVRQTINDTMVQAYWHIGRLIVENEQGGAARAAYGAKVLPELSQRLTAEYGKGFSPQSLWNFRQFYIEFPILSTAWRELRWSHFKLLMRVKDAKARNWYATETISQGWSVQALDRQISTLYYERLLSSQNKDAVREEAGALIATQAAPDPRDFIRDPYVLEFLGAQPGATLYESELESGLLVQLQAFLLELGKGFAFVSRQKHLRVFEEQYRAEGDNPTLGLILCSERNEAVAKYFLLADSQQLFASRYRAFLPSEAELQAELQRDRALLEDAQKGRT